MLVFLDTTGAVTATAPSTTGRNSAAMSTIYIVAPISGAATLSLSFRLPNGDEVNPALADTVHNAVEILKGVPLPDNQRVWSYAIPASVTRIAGTVTYTITTHTESMTGTGSGTFVVAPATTKTMPNTTPSSDVWEGILSELSRIEDFASNTIGDTEVKTIDGERITTVTALLADLVALIGTDGAESPIGGSTTITTLLDWVKDEALRLDAIIGSGSIPFAATLTEAINALNEMKVSKTSEPSAVYGTDGNGNTTAIPYSVGVKYDGHGNATSIPLRDNSGHVKTADPIAVDDAVSLGYYNREVGAITDGLRGLDNIVKGRSRALVFDNWEDALVAITSKGTEDLQIGDAVLIRDLGAPDAWISGISPNYDPYPGGIGVTNPFGDNALTFVVGWYAISPLESPKVNLDEYAKEDDLARLKKEVANLRANIPPEYFITDAAVAYAKTVPADALPFAEVQEVGGGTYAVDGALKNAAVSAIESVGVNILDLTPALNECLTDNGDGTYTLTNIRGKRFSAEFPFNLPKGYAEANCSIEILDTNVEGLTNISMRTKDPANGTQLSGFALKVGGQDYRIESGIADIYLPYPSNAGDFVTFKNPMIKIGLGYIGYVPYAKHTLPIPSEVQELDGWGMGTDVKNYNRLIWGDGKREYRQEIASIDLGSLSWSAQANNVFYGSFSMIAPPASYPERTRGVLTADYINSTSQSASSMPDKSILRFEWGVAIRDTAYTDAAAFKAAVSGKTMLYAAKNPVVTDLSAILPADNYIEVEGGGMITAVNEHGLAAPTKIEYQLKEATA